MTQVAGRYESARVSSTLLIQSNDLAGQRHAAAIDEGHHVSDLEVGTCDALLIRLCLGGVDSRLPI